VKYQVLTAGGDENSSETTMGQALARLSQLWDEVTEDFMRGKPTNVRPALCSYFNSYRRPKEVQLDGFCEPFLGCLDRKPKMVFLSLNPGALQPAWQALKHEGRPGTFVSEIRRAGSYTRWAAEWSYLKEPWQSYIAARHGANHHLVRFQFMKAWFGDDRLTPQDRVDFELYPWHSRTFNGRALNLEAALLREFIWDPLRELEAPLVFAFGHWWWKHLSQLGVEVIARLGDEVGRPVGLGYRSGARQGIVIGRLPHGGLVVAEKHSGPPPGPPALSKVPLFRQLIMQAINRS
jgi:hypothetical protein